MTDSTQPGHDWSAADSADLYGINAWGAGYYSISDSGDAQVTVNTAEGEATVSLMDIVAGMRARSLEMPAVLRIRNVLDHRIKVLNEAFASAIAGGGYNNVYRG
ncbi:MAG: arginine decarboxylase, partial [Haliea sp.]|nr:arginine decarboxylase [Haliea sp.]